MGLEFATEENAGRIYVDLTGKKIGEVPKPGRPPQHGGQQHGGSGGQHGGQYGGGGQPGGQQQDGDLVWTIFKAIKGCCVVM